MVFHLESKNFAKYFWNLPLAFFLIWIIIKTKYINYAHPSPPFLSQDM